MGIIAFPLAALPRRKRRGHRRHREDGAAPRLWPDRKAIPGAGLVYLHEHSLTADLAAGHLEPVLTTLAPPATVVSAVHAARPAPKVQAWIDFMAETFERTPLRVQRTQR